MNEDTLRLLEYEGMKDLFLPHMACDLGKSALRRRRPYRREEDLLRSLEEAGEAAAVLSRGARLPLGGCHDLGTLLTEVHDRGRPLEPEDLLHILETLECARALTIAITALPGEHADLELPRLLALAEEMPGFTLLSDRIADAVDERGRVRDDASPRLSAVRSGIRTTRSRIETRIATFINRKEIRGSLREPTPRFRSGRLVLSVKTDRRGDVRGVLHDVSQSGNTSFVEPEAVVADGNALEDLLAQERREVTRILWEITVRVLESEPSIREALAALSRIDLALGVATAARERGLVLPVLEEGAAMRFRRARHPILEILNGREAVVPLDLRLGEDFRLLVITGPNTGGKTVALKAFGLLQLMAQSGLPVPADEAVFPMLEGVYADIGDEQSLEQSLSTFSSHVSRISRFLATAGERTLVLLDELGSGTDPVEGAALGRGILDFLHERGVPAVVTTHLGSLKTYAFTHPGVSNASVEFDVETLSPTYRLLIGQPGASNALTIAERLGMPGEVVATARGLLTPEHKEGQEILEKAQEIRSEAEKRLREADDLRIESKDFRDHAAEEYRKAELSRQQVEKEAEDEMNEAL